MQNVSRCIKAIMVTCCFSIFTGCATYEMHNREVLPDGTTAPILQMYKGERLPKDQVATISYCHLGVYVDNIDKRMPALNLGSCLRHLNITDIEEMHLEILPGLRDVAVRYNKDGKVSGGMITLKLQALAGHAYRLNSYAMWDQWLPYIEDITSGKPIRIHDDNSDAIQSALEKAGLNP
jgi:hypothetical protein